MEVSFAWRRVYIVNDEMLPVVIGPVLVSSRIDFKCDPSVHRASRIINPRVSASQSVSFIAAPRPFRSAGACPIQIDRESAGFDVRSLLLQPLR